VSPARGALHIRLVCVLCACLVASAVPFASAPTLAGAEPSAEMVSITDAGWSDPVGTWDPVTRTAVLTTDVAGGVEIAADDVTLEGNGHAVEARGLSIGVSVQGRSSVRIHGLSVGLMDEDPEHQTDGDGVRNGVVFSDCTHSSFASGTVTAMAACVQIIGGADDAVSDSCLQYAAWDPACAPGVDASGSARLLVSGDTLYRAWISVRSSDGASLRQNVIQAGPAMSRGIVELASCTAATIVGNRGDGRASGLWLFHSNDCLAEGNVFDPAGPVWLGHTDRNTIAHNVFSATATSTQVFLSDSHDNAVYGNDFDASWSDLPADASVDASSSGNVFDLPKPIGGNWWSGRITPDVNRDGFVDVPFAFNGGTDGLAHVSRNAPSKPENTPLSLAYIGATQAAAGGVAHLSAVLTGPTGELPGHVVTFAVGSQTATASTGVSGIAVADLPLAQPSGLVTVTATCAGGTSGPGCVSAPTRFAVVDPGTSRRLTVGPAPRAVRSGILAAQVSYRSGEPSGAIAYSASPRGAHIRSTSLDWMVTTGSVASVKGACLLNGRPGYRFTLDAADGGARGRGRYRLTVFAGSGAIAYSAASGDAAGGITVR
jgi:hypothetical protein